MIILSHRGLWISELEKNTVTAFERSFSAGFGTETDVRDLGGKLVVSHDMPVGGEMLLADFLTMVQNFQKSCGKNLKLALNIKSDGLAKDLVSMLNSFNSIDAFVFDMSVPDTRSYINTGVPFFTRMSDVEPVPAFLNNAGGVWLDAFYDIWYDHDLISSLLAKEVCVCVVSPELHGRSKDALWKSILPFRGHKNFLLCTDAPVEAKSFFEL